MTQDRYVFHHADGRDLAFDLSQVERVSTRTPGPVDHRGEPTSRGVVLHWKNGARTEFGGELGETLLRAYLPRMVGRELVEETRTPPPGILKGEEAMELRRLAEAGPARPEDGPALRVARVTREVPPGLDGSPSDSGRAIFLEADGRGGWVEGSKREFEVVNDFQFSRPLPVGLMIKVARTAHQWWLVGADWPEDQAAEPDIAMDLSSVLPPQFAPNRGEPLERVTNPLDRLLDRIGAELVVGLGRSHWYLLFADGAVDLGEVRSVKAVAQLAVVVTKEPNSRELKFQRQPPEALAAAREARAAARDKSGKA